jgi:predicted nucleic acid-binding protein
VILLDATVISNFAHIQRLDLLRLALPGNAATTPQVIAELERGIATGRLPACDWAWLNIAQLSQAEEANLARVRLILDDGEASCIAVALERGGTIFSDDRDARRYAQRQKLHVSGPLGVLLLLVEEKCLTLAEADACLQDMIAHGYRSPVTSLADVRTSRS